MYSSAATRALRASGAGPSHTGSNPSSSASACASGSLPSTSARPGPVPAFSLLPARRSHLRRQRGPAAPRGVPAEFASGPDAVGIATQVAWTMVAGAAAYYFANNNQGPNDEEDEGPHEPCANCGGSGYEDCHCTRWSDGDVGCQSCNYTGYSRCKVCGGGGRAVRVPVTIEIRDSDRSNPY